MRKPLDFNHQGGIDLHIHTSASDGTFSPLEIIQMATRAGLQAISITDHDTTEGSRQALARRIPTGLHFITGVEISTQAPAECKVTGSLHILGYGIDPDFKPLGDALEQLRAARNQRTHHIVQRLNQMGIDLTLEQVKAEVGRSTPGRPHVARALIKAGVAADVNEAFEKWIGQDAPAYVGKKRLPCEQTFELIKAAGGISVLAHPYLIKCPTPNGLETLIQKLKALGLEGLEVYYPDHKPTSVQHYLTIAETHGLLITGGTDFHGRLIPDIQMGRGRGDFYVPYHLYQKLQSRLTQSNRL